MDETRHVCAASPPPRDEPGTAVMEEETMSSRILLVLILLMSPFAGATAQTGGVADVNGVSLPYEVQGHGAPLVLIHGWAVSRQYWDDDAAALAEHFRVITYDRRGYGEASGRADPTADPADLAALLDDLDFPLAHVIGHSQGSEVALTFALRYPERVHRLVLFGPPPPMGMQIAPDDLPPAAAWTDVGHRLGVDSMKEAVLAWAGAQFGEDPVLVGDRAVSLLSAYNGLDLLDPVAPSGMVSPATAGELARVTAPTLVLAGERDMAMVRQAVDLLSRNIPNAIKILIADAGHVANWTRPERFRAAVLDFLRQ